MDRRSKLLEVLHRVTRRDTTPAEDESLFDSGMLDSFALPEFVAGLEQEFGITIPDSDLSPRTFETLVRIEAYLDSRL